MTDYRTMSDEQMKRYWQEATPEQVEQALDDLWDEVDDGDESYTWTNPPGQVQPIRFEDSDNAMAIVAYMVFAASGFIMGMVFMRLLTWVWS